MQNIFLASGQEAALINTYHEYCGNTSRKINLIRKLIGMVEAENYQTKPTYGEIEIYLGEVYYKLEDTPAYNAPIIKQEEIAGLESQIISYKETINNLTKEIASLKDARNKTLAEMGCPFALGDVFYRIDYYSDKKIVKELISKIILIQESNGPHWEFYYGNGYDKSYLGCITPKTSDIRLFRTEEEARLGLEEIKKKKREEVEKRKLKEIEHAKKILEQAETK